MTVKCQDTIAFEVSQSYEYKANGKSQSALVSKFTSNFDGNATVYSIAYDDMGNITSISDSADVVQNRYEYDDLNQLVREDNRALGKSYTYTYDRPVTYRNPNRFYWQTSITQAGNIIAGLQKLFGNDKKEGKLFINNRYSQFLKLTSELITYKSFDNNNQLAFRLMGGIGYAYGNSSVMPYSEQFYIGGANSIRAFQVRNIGPGSYHPEETQYSYLDQTGDIKLEANLEYRFTIYEKFKGAFFFDAGNVWLLNREEERPGGEFNLKGFFKELAFGTGLGLRYDFSFLVVRADLGIPLHAPYDTSKNGYYNIDGKFLKNLLLNIAIGYPF